jgi:DNA repair exonuclease SbcCD nuclease subunit
MLGKLREAYTTAQEENCEFVAFGGDYFNSHRVFSYEIISEAMDIMCDGNMPTYACVGEHDLYGHSPNTYPSSTLAFMVRRCANFHILFEPIDLGNVVLHAKHEWENMQEAMKRQIDQTRLNVLICHELITNKKAIFDIVDTKTLSPCPFDIVVSDDLHDGYEIHEVGNTLFCNPGSLARRAISDINRTPQIAIIEAEKGEVPVVEIRQLKCAKPGNEVFGESIAELARNTDEFDGDAFTDEMLDFESESVDVHELIQKMGVKNGLRKEVLDYLAQKREVPILKI